MVISLLAAALVLAAFNVYSSFIAHDRAKLALMSRALAFVTLLAAILSPLAVAATYLAPATMAPLNLRLYHLSAGYALTDAVPLDDRILALACAAVPLTVVVFGLAMLQRLLLLFAAGEVFSSRTSATLGSLSLTLFLFVVAGFVMQAPISYFLTRSAGTLATVSLSLGLEDLVALFAAAVAAVVARVMSEATRLADENAEFI